MNDSASWTEHRLLVLNELKRIDATTTDLLREVRELRAEHAELKKNLASLRAAAAATGFMAGLAATLFGYLFP